jgi:hypothetical protein
MRGYHVRHWRARRDDLIAAYAADDLFSPPFAENLPYTVMEAMACGNSTAAFDVGGVGELVATSDRAGSRRGGRRAPGPRHRVVLDDPLDAGGRLGGLRRARAEADFVIGGLRGATGISTATSWLFRGSVGNVTGAA